MVIADGAPPTSRSDQRRNRALLLRAAQEVFALRGINAPLDVIAKTAGLGNATLYRHFPTRLDLIIEVLLVNLHDHDRAIADALEKRSGWAGFTDYLSWLFRQQFDNLGYMAAMREIPAGQNAHVDSLRDAALGGFTQLIDRAKDEGTMRADRWLEDVLLMLVVNENLMHLGPVEARAASRRLLQLCLASLSARPEPEAASAPEEISVLRRTLGNELAGLPIIDVTGLA